MSSCVLWKTLSQESLVAINAVSSAKHTSFKPTFFECDFEDSNIEEIYISNIKVPINLVCVYRSPVTDSDNFISTIRVVLDGRVINNELTVITDDMNVNIVGERENNNKYLNMLSESRFISFINVYNQKDSIIHV